MSLVVKSGSYTGNGTSQSIATGSDLTVGNVLLFVKGGSNIMQVTTAEMGSDKTQNVTGEVPASGRVTALTATGFNVGSDTKVNANGTVYHYVALSDSTGSDMSTFTYAGDAASPRDLTTPGFQPTLGMWWDDLGDTGGIRTGDMATDSWTDFNGVGVLTDRVLAIISTGFTVSYRNEVNGSGRNYYCVAIKDTANLFNTFTYTGNGSDDRNITGVGFQPEWALTKGDANIAAVRFRDESGDNSFLVDATGEAANRIQSFISDGIQVGTAANVNSNTVVYYGWAFKDIAAATTTSTSSTSSSISTSSTSSSISTSSTSSSRSTSTSSTSSSISTSSTSSSRSTSTSSTSSSRSTSTSSTSSSISTSSTSSSISTSSTSSSISTSSTSSSISTSISTSSTSSSVSTSISTSSTSSSISTSSTSSSISTSSTSTSLSISTSSTSSSISTSTSSTSSSISTSISTSTTTTVITTTTSTSSTSVSTSTSSTSSSTSVSTSSTSSSISTSQSTSISTSSTSISTSTSTTIMDINVTPRVTIRPFYIRASVRTIRPYV